MDGSHPPKMPLDELRRRVTEAEKLLRVARQLASDELRDPESSERAKDRIASLCSEVNALFPGLGAGPPRPPAGPDPAGDADAPDGDEDEADDEWDVDYEKLRAAIQNPALMGGFPEPERATFKAMAEDLLDAHDRHELYSRVTAAFEELERTTRAGADELRSQLARVLTFEELRTRSRA